MYPLEASSIELSKALDLCNCENVFEKLFRVPFVCLFVSSRSLLFLRVRVKDRWFAHGVCELSQAVLEMVGVERVVHVGKPVFAKTLRKLCAIA